MKFTLTETQLILLVLNSNNENLNLNSINTEFTYSNLIEKLEAGEYIKGRLLKFLYNEISKIEIELDANQSEILKKLLQRIKFKSTPR